VPPPNPGPPTRSEPREIAELRRLREDHPDLADAVDLQIELIQVQRRVQSRVSLPSMPLDAESLTARLAAPPILAFDQIPIDWGDLRFLLRATAAAMRNHGALEEEDFRRAQALARDADQLIQVARAWYEAPRGDRPATTETGAFDNVIQQSMRPFLTRAAEAIMARIDFSGWSTGRCPLCAGEPDLAIITPSADRVLICGRCLSRWRFDQITCPFCMNEDRTRMTSFASRDGRYRLYGCDVCERYIKAYDARRATRPVLPAVDSVATLPLDAAAMQKGYK
jgi:FdhE protein